MTTRLVAELGFPAAPTATRLLPARRGRESDNPDGYFEDAAFVAMHRRMLGEVGRARGWAQPRRDDAEISRLQTDYDRLVRQRTGSPRWSLKDPRLCLLDDVLFRALRACRVDHRVVTTVRPLAATTASLVRRGLAASEATRLAERFEDARRRIVRALDRRGCAVHVVEYDRLIHPDHMAACVQSLADFAGTRCPASVLSIIRPFGHSGRPLHSSECPPPAKDSSNGRSVRCRRPPPAGGGWRRSARP